MDLLPDELLLEIIWHDRDATGTLYSLSLVSQRFYRVVNPLLYENIRGSRFRASDFWKNIIRTLQQNPGLGRHIKSIATPSYQPTYADEAPSDLGSGLSDTLLRKLHYPYVNVLEERSMHGDNILLAFLVLLAPNLKQLDLQGFGRVTTTSFIRLPLVIEELGRIIYADLKTDSLPRRFESLRTLRLDLCEWSCFPPDVVLPFLMLPQLKSLTLDGWGKDTQHRRTYPEETRHNFFGYEREWPVRSSPVRELYLYNTDAISRMVFGLLMSCEALRIFECTVNMFNETDRNYWYTHVSEALLEHANSLQHLIIEEPNSPPLSYGSLTRPSSLASLQHLRVPYKVLLGNEGASTIPQYLPPFLEYLHVTFGPALRCTAQELDKIITDISEALCNACLTHSFPNLRGVELMILDDGDELNLRVGFEIESLRSVLRDRQIDLDVSIVCMPGGKSSSTNHARVTPTNDLLAIPAASTMRYLKTIFPAFASFSKPHGILKASTRLKPLMARTTGAMFWVDNNPYHPVFDPWDYENESENESLA